MSIKQYKIIWQVNLPPNQWIVDMVARESESNECIIEIWMQLFDSAAIPDGFPGTLSSDVKKSIYFQGLEMVNTIALLLAVMLWTPSTQAQKGLLHAHMQSC